MTFEELLDQAIALLQRRGRLTYRALKRQFDLDDDYLEDLKAELIQGQRLAVDEEGAVLVWIGDTASVVAPTAPAPAQAQTTLRLALLNHGVPGLNEALAHAGGVGQSQPCRGASRFRRRSGSGRRCRSPEQDRTRHHPPGGYDPLFILRISSNR
jgi:hypothetical protein